jgi:replicative DNA helicase
MNEVNKYNKKNKSSQLARPSLDVKLPPQAIDLEEAVLGSLMLNLESVHVIADILKPESFYKETHELIYSAIINLYKKSITPDILSVTQELKRTEKLDLVGGPWYITQLTNRESNQAEYHARIIQQKFIQRELIRLSTEVMQEAYSDHADCFDVLESLEKGLTAITKDVAIGKVQSIATMWNEVMAHNEVLLTKKGISGVPSGYPNIDRITAGWQSPDLIIIAARPAMGKTSLVCNFARNASVDFKIPGVIFSLEMSSRQIATRIFALESDTSISDFTRRGIANEQLTYIQNNCIKLINSPLYLDDTPSISITELRSKARKLKREKGIGYIIVDYLQLMEGVKNNSIKENREQVISSISRGLKSLAKELEIPIIALSQLSRAVETRGGDKRPQLSDLRESGAIEQDADIVAFIHRPEYYNVFEYDNGEDARGVAEIIFAKHRNGPIGTEKLRFISHLTKFLPSNDTPSYNSVTPIDYTEPRKNSMESNDNFLDDDKFVHL